MAEPLAEHHDAVQHYAEARTRGEFCAADHREVGGTAGTADVEHTCGQRSSEPPPFFKSHTTKSFWISDLPYELALDTADL